MKSEALWGARAKARQRFRARLVPVAGCQPRFPTRPLRAAVWQAGKVSKAAGGTGAAARLDLAAVQ